MSIYLIRHAQSTFNAVYGPNEPDPMIFDAPITELGETQAKLARLKVEKFNIKKVIVSPFTRTLQTAQLIFGNKLPFQINAEVREQLVNSCDVGSPPQKLAEDFPHLNFNHLDECWWHEGEKDYRGISVEPEEVLMERADRFVDYMKREGTQFTAIVSHGNFIRALTGIKPQNCEIIQFNHS